VAVRALVEDREIPVVDVELAASPAGGLSENARAFKATERRVHGRACEP
jgi:hypothetical protein